MTKLLRRHNAWRVRLGMGHSDRVVVLVEGRNFDTPFYERLLSAGFPDTSFEFYPAELIHIKGSKAGGYEHVKRLHDLLDKEGSLAKYGVPKCEEFIFFTDADDSRFRGKSRIEGRIVTTEYSDVEAEIVMNGDLLEATSIAYSLQRQFVSVLNVGSAAEQLAKLWRKWIVVRLAILALEDMGYTPSRKTAIASPLHNGQYGDFDTSKYIGYVFGLKGLAQDEWVTALRRGVVYSKRHMEAGLYGHLVKGKWVAPYIKEIVEQGCSASGFVFSTGIGAQSIVMSALSTIDFDHVWAKWYKPVITWI